MRSRDAGHFSAKFVENPYLPAVTVTGRDRAILARLYKEAQVPLRKSTLQPQDPPPLSTLHTLRTISAMNGLQSTFRLDEGSDGENYTPRTPRRTPMACTFCRGRKLKCDGRATCANCQKRSIPCTYVPVQPQAQR